MKTKILAVLAVAIVANIHTPAAESSNNATVRPFIWQAAVKPDAPLPSAQQGAQATFAEVASKVPSIPHYYSAQRNVPALPFNPYPKLQLFDLGDNKFVYDDSTLDYFSLFGESALASEDGGGMSAMFSPAYSFSSTDLWVKITSTGSTNFLLDVNNTVSGTYYGVGAKSSVDPDLFNTWTLLYVFPATSTNFQLAGTATAATRFYNAVNLDAYVGPSVSIVSPTTGATVNGDVPLRVAVTDILPLSSVEVYVGEIQVGVVQAGQNGTVDLPTYWFANGQHEIWVRVVNEGVSVDTDGDTVADSIAPFEAWGNVTLNFSNAVYMENYSPLYSAAGSINLQYSVTSAQDYTFEVFKTNGTLLHTASGQSVNGSISRQWNFTNLSGQSVDEPVYVFSLTYSPQGAQGAAAAVPGKMQTTNYVDKGVTVGKYVISYGQWENTTINAGLDTLTLYLSALFNEAAYYDDTIIGINREAYGTIYADFTSEPFRIRRATQTNDLLALTNALKNPITGSWFFDGHSDPDGLIAGEDDWLDVELNAPEIAACLGSTYVRDTNGFSISYGRRLFSTVISGCGSGGGLLSIVTGTPPGVQQVGNPQIKKSAFLGFKGLTYAGSTNNNWDYAVHAVWVDGNDYDTPLSDAVAAANTAYPSVVSWKPTIYGYRFLEYNGDESR